MLSAIKKIGGIGRGHFELRKGSVAQNVQYCTKGNEGKFHVEYGERPADKKHGDKSKPRELLMAAIKEGKDVHEIWEDPKLAGAFFSNIKQTEYFISLEMQKRARVAPDVRYYYGETGAGKSFRAEAEAKAWCDERKLDPDLEIYRHPGGMWMDGYSSQKVILLDDFLISKSFDFKHALKLFDVYKYQVQRKGSSAWIQAELIIITSSVSIDTFDEPKVDGQFRRRMKVYEEMFKKDRADLRGLFAKQDQVIAVQRQALRNAQSKIDELDYQLDMELQHKYDQDEIADLLERHGKEPDHVCKGDGWSPQKGFCCEKARAKYNVDDLDLLEERSD
jgi:hypothetical protein